MDLRTQTAEWTADVHGEIAHFTATIVRDPERGKDILTIRPRFDDGSEPTIAIQLKDETTSERALEIAKTEGVEHTTSYRLRYLTRVYVRDNGGAHSDLTISFISTHLHHERVLELLSESDDVDGDGTYEAPSIARASDLTWWVGRDQTMTLPAWWADWSKRLSPICDDRVLTRIKAKAEALGLEWPKW
jgi:hypothetical protein